MIIKIEKGIYEFNTNEEITRHNVMEHGNLIAIRDGDNITHVKNKIIVDSPVTEHDLDDVNGLMDINTLLTILSGDINPNQFIIEKINMTNQYGNNVLFEACHSHHKTKTFQKIIDCGVNINHQNNAGNTALMVAARFNIIAAASELLIVGANQNIKNNKGQTALDIAQQHHSLSVISALENSLLSDIAIAQVSTIKIENKKNNGRLGRL